MKAESVTSIAALLYSRVEAPAKVGARVTSCSVHVFLCRFWLLPKLTGFFASWI